MHTLKVVVRVIAAWAFVSLVTACGGGGGGTATPPPLSGYMAEQSAMVSAYQTFQGGLSYPLLQVQATLPATSPLKPALALGLVRMLVQSVHAAAATAATPTLTFDGVLGLYESGFTISGNVITDNFFSDSAGTQSAGTLSVTYPSGTTIPTLGQASATPPYTMTIAANITAGNLPISGSGTITLLDSTGAGEIKGTFTLTNAPEVVTADLSLSDTGTVTGTALITQNGETISATGLSGPFNGTISGKVAVAPQGYTGTVAISISKPSFMMTLNTGKGTASGTLTPQGALVITFDDGTTETLPNPVTTSPTATPTPTPTPTYTIGGTVSGLAAGTQMVLQDNGGDNLPVATNGAFTFAAKLITGASYAVTVNTQPTGQTCAVSNSGAGTVNAANVTTVSVTCTGTTAFTYFAYVANSGDNTVSVYGINASTGALTAIGSPVVTGTNPSSVTVNPAGTFAYVANRGGSTVSAYSINATTGALTQVAGSPFAAGAAPNSVTVAHP